MGLVQNSKKTLNGWVDKILVELSCHYIKHLAKQTLKKQDNSSYMESSPNPLTQEDQHTIIATSSADTSEKTIMTENDNCLLSKKLLLLLGNGRLILLKSTTEKHCLYDKLALIDDEFHEWFD